jgi:hypothetical protein
MNILSSFSIFAIEVLILPFFKQYFTCYSTAVQASTAPRDAEATNEQQLGIYQSYFLLRWRYWILRPVGEVILGYVRIPLARPSIDLSVGVVPV